MPPHSRTTHYWENLVLVMIAKEVMYHSKCLLALYGRSEQKSCVFDDNENDFENQVHGQVLAELALYMKLQMKIKDILFFFLIFYIKDKGYILKLINIANLYKTRVRELGGHRPDRVHTTKLKQRLMLHIKTLKEFQDSNNDSYLEFNGDVGKVLIKFCEKSYDDEAFVLSEVAKL